MQLIFTAPRLLSLDFSIPLDATIWSSRVYRKVKDGWTPVRPRATFGSWQSALIERTPVATALKSQFGIYVLAFENPYPSIYIGIAANSGRSPEGVLNRIKKHRVKAAGSHVGVSPDVVGGVAHMKNWRKFAVDRSDFYAKERCSDEATDARLIVATLQDSSIQSKKDLERFEKSLIVDQSGIRSSIERRLWPSFRGKVFVLNGEKGKPSLSDSDQIVLW